MTITDALRQGMQALKKTSDAPALDAQRLLLHVLKRNETSWLMAHSETTLSAPQEILFGDLVQRRLHGEPLAYILGSQDFYGRPFMVKPDVLIPRPATEELVDQAVGAIKRIFDEKKRPLIIADIGTGSGCIAITLVLEAGAYLEQVYATDISAEALAVAQKNVAYFNVEKKVTLLHGDMLAPLVNKNVDLLVSNPPYVPTEELQNLSVPEKIGLQFEPRRALDGGLTGEDFTTQLTATDVPVIYETTGGKILSKIKKATSVRA